MTERGQVPFGATLIDYTVQRSRRRRKTVEITLDPAYGVVVAAPLETDPDRLRGIVLKRAGWIVRQGLADLPRLPTRMYVSGESLPYLGRQVRLFVQHAEVKRPTVTFAHWSFRLIAPSGLDGEARRLSLGRVVRRWYERRAAIRLPERVERWATVAGCRPSSVLVRDQRQRWASCSPTGELRFNWRLIMAPPALIDYVLLHELVHLRIRKHSQEFWTELGRLMPDFQVRRARLRELGPYLTL
jgi:predicted metal-dependent hydrolase